MRRYKDVARQVEPKKSAGKSSTRRSDFPDLAASKGSDAMLVYDNNVIYARFHCILDDSPRVAHPYLGARNRVHCDTARARGVSLS